VQKSAASGEDFSEGSAESEEEDGSSVGERWNDTSAALAEHAARPVTPMYQRLKRPCSHSLALMGGLRKDFAITTDTTAKKELAIVRCPRSSERIGSFGLPLDQSGHHVSEMIPDGHIVVSLSVKKKRPQPKHIAAAAKMMLDRCAEKVTTSPRCLPKVTDGEDMSASICPPKITDGEDRSDSRYPSEVTDGENSRCPSQVRSLAVPSSFGEDRRRASKTNLAQP